MREYEHAQTGETDHDNNTCLQKRGNSIGIDSNEREEPEVVRVMEMVTMNNLEGSKQIVIAARQGRQTAPRRLTIYG